ncbi:threonine synthase [Bordetella bronchiseptica]|uniref:threonine synthase n=1 Tax=Bordetella bronchiseptica TaxID=518 RepID=UPI000444E003|nr:threonine synthase [Bordetella bronchiseptica]AWP85554.1 threonine synthase [Bordetella bronchiseptica]AWQ11132.1 threonine synthase [Bordetella bronchiseptica]AXT89768.1 threonine synthase [Bordetella bronchiseptica]KDB83433.1 threonine synthase [Bordetella bronchiseptica CARE970018BB]KDC95983.1 threonine synthase [Bordetella bronchiseptica MBORD670]
MKYISTRGGMAPQSFSDILLEGLAPDGGLAIPEQLPQVDAATLESWRGLSYADLAFEVLSLFATDIPAEDLRGLTRAAYRQGVFKSEDIVPVRELGQGLQLLGLSEGPTLAFKDMAMQFLGQVFEYVLTRRGTTLNIVGATSGDTGSAAEYALRGKQGVAVFMLSPHGRMSAFQRAQMYSLQDENIHNIAVRGVFDQAQDIVKQLAGDLAFKTRYRLGAVNSINWARIAAQVVYYFHGWLRAAPKGGEVSFAVPSGNFGNILSGHIARGMGVPIRRLVLATNENNVLEEFFRTGIYRPRGPEHTYATSSPSMDISRASNFERFVFDLVGRDPGRVASLWADLARDGSFDLSALKPQFETRYGFVAGASSHADRLLTIRNTFDETGVLVDPHTADGIKVARQFVEPGVPMLVLETALPAKFAETIEAALGRTVPPPADLADLESLPQRVTLMDCDAQAVRAFIEAHAKV